MIKAGIAGAETRQAGELIRILVNHPEVEIATLYAPGHTGENITGLHHGLVGEADMFFTDRLDTTGLDILFVATSEEEASEIIDLADRQGNETLRIVDMTGVSRTRPGFTGGLSEIFRKPLVRGAMRCWIPTPPASALLIALFPAAANLLLNGSIRADITLPADIPADKTSGQAVSVLSGVQNSFSGDLEISLTSSASVREMRLSIEIDTPMMLPDIMSLYDRIYDDHNFTWFSTRSFSTAEVAGTNKCLLTLSKPTPSILRIEAVADPRMRGGAGEAVHAMNLLFGLHERTGLALKASEF